MVEEKKDFKIWQRENEKEQTRDGEKRYEKGAKRWKIKEL